MEVLSYYFETLAQVQSSCLERILLLTRVVKMSNDIHKFVSRKCDKQVAWNSHIDKDLVVTLL